MKNTKYKNTKIKNKQNKKEQKRINKNKKISSSLITIIIKLLHYKIKKY